MKKKVLRDIRFTIKNHLLKTVVKTYSASFNTTSDFQINLVVIVVQPSVETTHISTTKKFEKLGYIFPQWLDDQKVFRLETFKQPFGRIKILLYRQVTIV